MSLTNKQITSYLKSKISNIGAIYLSGSRLNHLAISDTDYDVVVIKETELSDLVNASPYSKEHHYPDDLGRPLSSR